MEDNNLQKAINYVRSTKILLYGLIVALIVGTVGLGLSLKRIQGSLYTKEYQINTLVEEIGDLREENEFLYQDILKNRQFTKQGIDLLNDSIFTIIDDQEFQNNTLISDLSDKKQELLSLLNEKDFAINNLQSKNSRLASELELQDYDDGVKNILLLGTNGGLTDTIMIASVNPEQSTITLLSIPRDLYINGRKINSVYNKYGIEKFKKDIHTITGISINKHAVFNFDGFQDVVDSIGGIDIYVKKGINDYYYPTAGDGYELYSIAEGSHHMKGDDALKYVRSRKSTSDFDRSKRQQQIIQSIRTKVKRLNIISDLDQAIDLFDAVVKNVKTDVDVFEALYMLHNYQDFKIETNNTIDTSNLLYATKSYNGQYILLPNNGDFFEVKQLVSNLIKN